MKNIYRCIKTFYKGKYLFALKDNKIINKGIPLTSIKTTY